MKDKPIKDKLISPEAMALQQIARALESIACALATPTSKPFELKDDTHRDIDLSDWTIPPTKPIPPPNVTYKESDTGGG